MWGTQRTSYLNNVCNYIEQPVSIGNICHDKLQLTKIYQYTTMFEIFKINLDALRFTKVRLSEWDGLHAIMVHCIRHYSTS